LAITGNVNAQIIDGMVDFLDLRGNIPGKFLLVFGQFINKIFQFNDQIYRQNQGKTIIGKTNRDGSYLLT